MPTKIMDFDETDNPFRPEGDLAKEAEVFVHELKVKAEKEVNDIIHQTCAVSPNTSLLNAPSVNEIIHHEDNGDETDNHNHNSNKSRTGQSESVVVGAVVTGDNINFSSSSNNNNNNSNSSNNNNNNSNSNNSNSNNNNSKSNEASRLVDGEAPASQPEKVGKASKKSKKSKDGKPKCGCILS
jgi:hypothetical protein